MDIAFLNSKPQAKAKIMMKFIVKCLLLACILLMLACPVIFLLTVIDKESKVDKSPELSFDNVTRVEQLVKNNKPDSILKKEVRHVQMSEQDLNLLADYGASQLGNDVIVYPEIRLVDPLIYLCATVKIPKTPLGEYINTEIRLVINDGKPDIDYIRIGRMNIPGVIINFVASFVGQHLLTPMDYNLFARTMNDLKSVSIRGKQLLLVYQWNPHSLAQIHESGKDFVIPPEHQDKLVFYANALTDLAVTVKKYHSGPISLSRVIRPLFQLACEQSSVSKDPVKENQALLQVLSLFCFGHGIDKLVSVEKFKQVKPLTSIHFTLSGRDDLPKHFLISAGLAASAGSKLSNFAGLSKEVDDSDMGSGFSFADLAADRAGVRLAELATESGAGASRLQQKMAAVTKENEFMPQIDRLPEGIMELEFKKQYKDLDSKAYAMIDDEISRRIDACSVYK